jgi:hypothetical protein
MPYGYGRAPSTQPITWAFHLGPPCPTLQRRPQGGLPVGQTAYGRPLPLWTPHAVRLWPISWAALLSLNLLEIRIETKNSKRMPQNENLRESKGRLQCT